MKAGAFLVAVLLGCLHPVLTLASELQQAIDQAPAGSVIELSRGLYAGNLTIKKPLTLRGVEDGVVIRGDGKQSVISVTSSNVTIERLIIEGSGGEHQTVDSGIEVKGANAVIVRGNRIRDCLFGINFEQTNRSTIEENSISSKNASLGLRGDGIRLWYSHGNTIRRNVTKDVRDNVFWYSSSNTITKNVGYDSRYSLHFMYADHNEVSENEFQHNSVGIFLMFSLGSSVRNNLIANSTGPFGIGIGMKDSSNILVENNEVLYNARGFYLDSSPFQPGTVNHFRGNQIDFNTTAILLHGTLLPSTFTDNVFKGNIEDVVNDTRGSHLEINTWKGNWWDNYEGFDRNGDGYGDVPHEVRMYADRIWAYLPAAKLFYASPVLDFMNFLWKLMPFSEPELIARDEMPRVGSPKNSGGKP